MQIGSDSSSIDVSKTDLLDALNITQSDEKKERLKSKMKRCSKNLVLN